MPPRLRSESVAQFPWRLVDVSSEGHCDVRGCRSGHDSQTCPERHIIGLATSLAGDARYQSNLGSGRCRAVVKLDSAAVCWSINADAMQHAGRGLYRGRGVGGDVRVLPGLNGLPEGRGNQTKREESAE
jgi:hypothetical protein